MTRKQNNFPWPALVLSASVAAALVACGGNSGGTASTTPVTLSGVAATGAAFAGAVVAVTDKSGADVGSGTVDADGRFNIRLSNGALAPFVLNATRTDADGAAETLVSVVTSVSANAATVNITPITTLIASRLSPSANPSKLASEVGSGTTVTSSTLASAVADVQAILEPILSATETAAINPLTGSFPIDGTGYDRLLDSIKVSITPADASSSNIEIGLRMRTAEGTPPLAIQFTSGEVVSDIQQRAPTIDRNALLGTGTSALIQQHLAQLTACFALPTASRVSTANPTGAAAINANQASVTAAACRDAFIQDGGVITFKSNGSTIGAKASSAFRGLFYDGGTNTTFNQGSYEFSRENNDIVVGYKKTDPSGAVSYDTFALRLDADGKLKQIGNQYNYPGGVSAYQQLKRFITLNQSAFDYYSTGYVLNVNHVTGGSGVDGSIFDRVEVTSPRNTVLVLKPKAGFSQLQLVSSGTVLSSNFVRLRSEYVNTNNASDPATKDSASLFFANRNNFSNEVISSIPGQAVWTFKYFLAGNTGTTADATQHHKTRARALTIPELKTKGFAALTADTVTEIQAGANAGGIEFGGMKPISGQTSIPMTWTVSTGAIPPTSIQAWGAYVVNNVRGSFNDSASVLSTARSASILCVPTGVTDTHCLGATGTAFVTPTYLNGAHLLARDVDGREFAHFYAAYQLNP